VGFVVHKSGREKECYKENKEEERKKVNSPITYRWSLVHLLSQFGVTGAGTIRITAAPNSQLEALIFFTTMWYSPTRL
jgi:hypothetical protein